jgi:hypothetical protein
MIVYRYLHLEKILLRGYYGRKFTRPWFGGIPAHTC